MNERFDIDVGYNDPLDPRDPEPEDRPSPDEYDAVVNARDHASSDAYERGFRAGKESLEAEVAVLCPVHDGFQGPSRPPASQCTCLEIAEGRRHRMAKLEAALKTLANPNPEEFAASPYVRRMARYARAALEQ